MKQYKIMTDENGDFSLDLPALEKGTYTMKAIFEGDSDAYGSEITKTLIIQGRAYAISIEANDEIIQGDTITLTLSFEDEDGSPVIEPGRTIKLYQEYVISGITLTSDKDILPYADNDIVTLTAKVTTSSGGIPVGVDVVFKKDGVLLDTVQTNTHGIATYSYASTGAGDITLSVECDLWVEIFKTDVGYGSYFINSIWLSRTIENDGVLITDNHPDSTSEFAMWYMYILPNHQQATSMSECQIWESDKDYCIEMDIIDSDASNTIQLRPQASGEFLHSQEISQLNDTTPFHLKIIVSGGISYWFVDDNNSPIYIENSIDLGESYGIRIGIMKQQSLKFNNLIVYELDEPFTTNT